MPIICSIRRCTGDSRVLRQDRKTQINGRVTRDHIHFKSSVFENPQCHLCKFWPSLLPTNDLLLPHIQDRRNLFDRPLPICLAFEKIHSFFESEVESIGFLWGSGRGAMYINLISTKKLLLTWRFFPKLYKRLKHNRRGLYMDCTCPLSIPYICHFFYTGKIFGE